MENQKLCPAGAMLAQRLELGVKNIQDGAAEIKIACNGVAKTLQDIRDTTTALHTRMVDVERRADKNDTETVALGKKVEGHIGVHIGFEQAGVMTGRRYAVIGVVGAIVVSLVACATFLQAFMP